MTVIPSVTSTSIPEAEIQNIGKHPRPFSHIFASVFFCVFLSFALWSDCLVFSFFMFSWFLLNVKIPFMFSWSTVPQTFFVWSKLSIWTLCFSLVLLYYHVQILFFYFEQDDSAMQNRFASVVVVPAPVCYGGRRTRSRGLWASMRRSVLHVSFGAFAVDTQESGRREQLRKNGNCLCSSGTRASRRC